MDPTTPSQPLPTSPVTPISPNPVPPKNNLLSVFIVIIPLLALCAIGFLAYQNYQLKHQISQFQPTITPVPTPDATANWKLYSLKNFSIKVPSELIQSRVPESEDHLDLENSDS